MLVVRHFRPHLEAISDAKALDLLYLAQVNETITNADVRSALHTKRGGAWVWLARPTELGLLEKRGHTYRASDYSRELVACVSQVFRGAVRGEFPESFGNGTARSIPPELFTIAAEGVEALYERGRITQEEHARRMKLVR